MILVDVNLLIYSQFEQAPNFAAARRWLHAILSGSEPVGLPWSSVLGFLRISTDARAMRDPFAAAQAAQIVQEWFAAGAVPVAPGEQYWQVMTQLLAVGQCSGPLVSDAHLATLALERGALLCTTDRDFARFPGLRWKNPLDPA